jgi:hypothetical protein
MRKDWVIKNSTAKYGYALNFGRNCKNFGEPAASSVLIF